MESNELVMLTLDLDIPNLWENSLAKRFPDTKFIIKNAHPLGDDTFSGLVKIENGNFKEIQNFLESHHPLTSLEIFHRGSGLYYFLTPDDILPNILRNGKCVLNWPVNFQENYKRVKFILRDYEVDNVISPLEERNIDIKKFSKVRMNFNLKEILTPKQKEILTPSIKYGYYEFPKRINLNELSKKIGVSPSTLCVHLQKIESKILNSNYQDLLFNV
jgi:hypothetical protein